MLAVLLISFFEHLEKLFLAVPIERLIGYCYMFGIIFYILFLGVKHKNEFWEAIRGADGKLETPEMITMLVMIIYINLILADTFLGLTPSDGVFWSLDGIIFFALTGRVMMNRFGNGDKNKGETQPQQPFIVEDKEENNDLISRADKIAFILKNASGYEKVDLNKLNDAELNKIYEILQEAEDNIDESLIA